MKKKTSKEPKKSKDIYVKKEMLFEVRDELKADIKSLAGKVAHEFQGLKAEVHRIGLLVEEQNARNIFVLDGYQQIYHSQKDLSDRMGSLEKEWYEFKKTGNS